MKLEVVALFCVLLAFVLKEGWLADGRCAARHGSWRDQSIEVTDCIPMNPLRRLQYQQAFAFGLPVMLDGGCGAVIWWGGFLGADATKSALAGTLDHVRIFFMMLLAQHGTALHELAFCRDSVHNGRMPQLGRSNGGM